MEKKFILYIELNVYRECQGPSQLSNVTISLNGKKNLKRFRVCHDNSLNTTFCCALFRTCAYLRVWS